MRKEYLAQNGERHILPGGVAAIIENYDSHGRLVEATTLDADGAPTLDKDKVSSGRITYDACGNPIEVACFGVDGAPVLHKDGIARFTSAYDARGNLMEQAYFGVDSAPVLHNDGIARFTSAYDARGNRIEQAYFGVDGALVLHKDGVARFTSAYDARGNLIEQAYFGIDGAPCCDVRRFHRREVERDALGREVRVAHFGVAGDPVLRSNTLVDDDCIEDIFKSWRGAVLSGLLTEAEIAASSTGGFHAAVYAYDARGNIAERRFLDIAGNECLGPNGFSVEAIMHDPMGRPVRFAPSGPDDDDTSLSVVIGYDAIGNAVSVAYRDRADCLADGAQGFARAELSYDRFGELQNVAYFTASGEAFTTGAGEAEVVSDVRP